MIRPIVIAALIAGSHGLPARQTAESEVSRYSLPAVVTYPEGIALEKDGRAFYTASAENGALVRVELSSGEARTVVPAGVLMEEDGAFPGLLGLALDRENLLWVAGGRTGAMHVVDARGGRPLKRFQSPRSGSLINDVAVTGGFAYFTDSLNPVLWRVQARGRIGELEPWIALEGTPVRYGKGVNLNGIVATPDSRDLIVVHMTDGLLFRIDIASRQITRIEVSGGALTGADGLVLDGERLYVVRQPENEIAVLQLSRDLARAKVRARWRDPALQWPATAVKAGDRLLVVNTQFNRRKSDNASRPFEIVGIPLTELTGAHR